ncbi:MAG: HlyD family secretion protein [Betaproteobacteria bacterium]|nr:HlyD family secretion protein [Betaproteobacteria bacterium]
MKGTPEGREGLRLRLLIGGTLVALVVAALAYLLGGRYVSTDDAYVQAARVDISANREGRIVRIDVTDNQRVRRGEPLFELDAREAAIAVAQARARLAASRLDIAALEAAYRSRQAATRDALDRVAYRKRELARVRQLAARGIASQSTLDEAVHAAAAALAQADAAAQEQARAAALLGNNPALPIDEHPSVKLAKAALARAKLDLSYMVVRAPMDGVVAKVEGVQVGDYIKAGVPLFALVSSRDVWVEANFKENALAKLRRGQAASIALDAYPRQHFEGRLESFSPGTGSSFSLLPPENATGNWVKVVQRLPVRLSIENDDPNAPLRAGLSAEVSVDTGQARWQDLF